MNNQIISPLKGWSPPSMSLSKTASPGDNIQTCPAVVCKRDTHLPLPVVRDTHPLKKQQKNSNNLF